MLLPDNKIRSLLAIVLAASLGGCGTFSDLLGGAKKDAEAVSVPYEERPVEEPIDANEFSLAGPLQTVIGEPQIVFAGAEDTFSDLARTYGLGYDELVAANPEIDPWLPGEGMPILLPTQYVLPDAPRRGVVLNIASKRLFYFPAAADGELQRVFTFPIGIGRVGWETPVGATSVIAKAENPSWWVPASVRKEHAEMGDPLPSVVPPGPDNPLGTRVLKLDMPGYLIHGTNQPYGVGMRVSHGCVRLYPENIEFLYPLVDIGEPVTIVNDPYLIGQQGNRVFFEAHAPLEDDTVPAEDRLQEVLAAARDVEGAPLNDHLQRHIVALSEVPNGMPISIAEYDANEIHARARVVRNIVAPDPNAYTLTEVREMMDAVEAEEEVVQ